MEPRYLFYENFFENFYEFLWRFMKIPIPNSANQMGNLIIKTKKNSWRNFLEETF